MTTIIIQARLRSTRLPCKVLLSLAGKPLLYHVINRCKQSKLADKVIVATTKNPEDILISEMCKEWGVECFRGDSKNVSNRYYKAACTQKSDLVVRVTSDCPLVDPRIIDLCIKRIKLEKCSYISTSHEGNKAFPRGLDVEVFTIDALKTSSKLATRGYEKEHVTPYIWENKNGKFRICDPLWPEKGYIGGFRLTVDYFEDYVLMALLYKKFYRNGNISVKQVLSYLSKNMDLVKINASLKQKSIY